MDKPTRTRLISGLKNNLSRLKKEIHDLTGNKIDLIKKRTSLSLSMPTMTYEKFHEAQLKVMELRREIKLIDTDIDRHNSKLKDLETEITEMELQDKKIL